MYPGEGERAAELRHPFPSPDYLSARFARRLFFSPTPIFSPFPGAWFQARNLAWDKIISHKHKNLSYLFIKNINGFFGMKPSSKSQALLQVYVHEGTFVYHTKMLGNAISFENCGSFSQELCGQGILSFGTSW